MADVAEKVAFTRTARFKVIVAAGLLVAVAAGAWLWMTRGRESTDDAQVDSHVTQVATRIGGTILKVLVTDNQPVEAGAVLVELDPRDFRVMVDRARADLADAEASAAAAQISVPLTSTAATNTATSAQGSVEQAQSIAEGSATEVDVARARLASAIARQREAEANAAKSAKDVERLRGLLAKDEVSQAQFDAAVSAAEAQKAASDSVRAQVTEAEAGIRVAESRLAQSRIGEAQARTALRTAQTVPEQVAATKARAASAQARVEAAKASLAQAELNFNYTVIKAPAKGIVAKKSVNPGQVVQSGQPLLAIVEVDNVWITANFKETQLSEMRPGQSARIDVDAYGGRTFLGKVDSIAPATGARFSLLPAENATGNFVKVVQRVPVKIVIEGEQDADHLLRPGMSVIPTVFTR